MVTGNVLSMCNSLELGAVAPVLHAGQLFCAGPGDGQQKGGVAFGFHIVPDGVAESEESAGGEIVRLAVYGDSELAFEDLDGGGAVGVVLFHVSGILHGDEDDAEVVLLEEGPGVKTGWPGLFFLRVVHLFAQVELRHFVDHGAVLQGGCHMRSFVSANKFTLSGG